MTAPQSTSEPWSIRVLDAAKEVLGYMSHDARIELHPEMLTGPYNRVADNSLTKKLLRWEPKTMFMDGLHRTIDWYVSSRDEERVSASLELILTER